MSRLLYGFRLPLQTRTFRYNDKYISTDTPLTVSRLQTLPNELFANIIELVVAEGGPADSQHFSRDAEKASIIARNGSCSGKARAQLREALQLVPRATETAKRALRKEARGRASPPSCGA